MRISHILAGIFSAAEKTAAKINSANIFVRMSLILKNFRRRQRVKGRGFFHFIGRYFLLQIL